MPTRIAFTSCMRIAYDGNGTPDRPFVPCAPDLHQEVWTHVLRQHMSQPLDALLLLGDVVYSDYYPGSAPEDWPLAKFAKLMHLMYASQARSPQFFQLMQTLRHSRVPIAAVWDDHDYGFNNAHSESTKFAGKVATSKLLFEQFVHYLNTGAAGEYPPLPSLEALPTDCPEQGIERLGNEALTLGDGVKIALLDCRFYRQKPTTKNTDGTPPKWLGDSQWQALETQLQPLPAGALLVVGAGSPYSLGDQSWSGNDGAHFANFEAFTRLASEKHLIFLTGDIHKNALKAHPGFVEIAASSAHQSDIPTKLGITKTQNFGLLNVSSTSVLIELFHKGGRTAQYTFNRANGALSAA